MQLGTLITTTECQNLCLASAFTFTYSFMAIFCFALGCLIANMILNTTFVMKIFAENENANLYCNLLTITNQLQKLSLALGVLYFYYLNYTGGLL